jgi:hypothetical protein
MSSEYHAFWAGFILALFFSYFAVLIIGSAGCFTSQQVDELKRRAVSAGYGQYHPTVRDSIVWTDERILKVIAP